MKLIEGMKHLKVLEKRIDRTAGNIQQYSSALSNEKLPFGSEDEQKAKIASLVQSGKDLATEWLTLKRDIEYTNTMIMVEITGREYAISQLLQIRRMMGGKVASLYKAMNDSDAENRFGRRYAAGGDITIIKLYDEEEKMKDTESWLAFCDAIDSKLEVINATTDVIAAP